jgi:hypothetical protein
LQGGVYFFHATIISFRNSCASRAAVAPGLIGHDEAAYPSVAGFADGVLFPFFFSSEISEAK